MRSVQYLFYLLLAFTLPQWTVVTDVLPDGSTFTYACEINHDGIVNDESCLQIDQQDPPGEEWQRVQIWFEDGSSAWYDCPVENGAVNPESDQCRYAGSATSVDW